MSDTALEKKSLYLVKRAMANLIASKKCSMKKMAGVLDNLARNEWMTDHMSTKQLAIYKMLMEELDHTIDEELK